MKVFSFALHATLQRHNYLAIRLPRYRGNDPFIRDMEKSNGEEQWIGQDVPSLEASEEDVFEIEVPGYDLRKLIQARDPLCVANAFDVQIRLQLATLLGIRMCPDCPHCAESARPCQDALGSSAEMMGGFAGRSDALFGAVECQKTTGSLHLHYWLYNERLHQHHTLQDIGTKLQQGLVTAAQFKEYVANICCESYPDPEAHERDVAELEKQWPRFAERRPGDAQNIVVQWGPHRIGRIPPFIRRDAKFPSEQHSRTPDGTPPKPEDWQSACETTPEEGARYKKQFDAALQHNQERVQHHIHPLKADGSRRIPNACRSRTKPKEYKHEAPWNCRMNSKKPLPLLVRCILVQCSSDREL